jgi:hypothetical protein
MVSPGNHESECHIAQCLIHSKEYGEKLNNFTAYNKRWHMPSDTSNGALNMWYSFNIGPVHVVSLNSETDFPSAEERSHVRFLPALSLAPAVAVRAKCIRWVAGPTLRFRHLLTAGLFVSPSSRPGSPADMVVLRARRATRRASPPGVSGARASTWPGSRLTSKQPRRNAPRARGSSRAGTVPAAATSLRCVN